jgi:hypothetical protein
MRMCSQQTLCSLMKSQQFLLENDSLRRIKEACKKISKQIRQHSSSLLTLLHLLRSFVTCDANMPMAKESE